MEAQQILDLMNQGAFLVRRGSIALVNSEAADCLLEPGTPIADLLFTGAEEYAAFGSGTLCLQLRLGTVLREASVTRTQDGDLFLLDPPQADPALQALSLAAMELSQPLHGAIQTAEQLLHTLPEGTAGDIAGLKRRLYQMTRQLKNMSDAARYQENPTGAPEVRDICAVLDEIFETAAAMGSTAGIRLHYQGLRESHLCPVDGERLERAVYNLITNAAKFSEPGAVIHASLRRTGKYLALTVSDSGSGIPAALRSHLHDRYKRQLALEDPRHGIGLGMVLIRAAAAAHRGTVLLETSDTGTRVTLTFSLAQPMTQLRSPIFRPDYAGGLDHSLVELSEFLPPDAYL